MAAEKDFREKELAELRSAQEELRDLKGAA